MSGNHNRRQKQLQQATRKILEIARRNKLLNGTRFNFVWTMEQNTDFSEQQLVSAWNQHFNSNKPTKAEKLELQRKKDERISSARFYRNTRPPTPHNPGRHKARHGSAKNAKAVQAYRDNQNPRPSKRERKVNRY